MSIPREHFFCQIEGEKDFSERMYIYNYRLYDRYRRHAASFAVIGYAGKKKDTGEFEKKLWDFGVAQSNGCETRFRFPVIRLGDYAKDEESGFGVSSDFGELSRAVE
ncbi:hypothetical protein QUF80_19650 [Desulfococcaceae bacterium HSG8]|nr:hypothetical protein [Desulfococcaceae bacterium HSG8]